MTDKMNRKEMIQYIIDRTGGNVSDFDLWTDNLLDFMVRTRRKDEKLWDLKEADYQNQLFRTNPKGR